jgi:hypothetical protein
MQPDYKALLTDVLKKQIVVLGPDITLAKARNVKGLTVSNDGTVNALDGDPKEIIKALIDEFLELSEMIVKKTMEPLLSLETQNSSSPTPTTTNNVSPLIPPLPPSSLPKIDTPKTEEEKIVNITPPINSTISSQSIGEMQLPTQPQMTSSSPSILESTPETKIPSSGGDGNTTSIQEKVNQLTNQV